MTLDTLTDDELDHAVVVAAELHSPEVWLTRVLPGYVGANGDETVEEAEALFAAHHREFWAWLWSIDDGRPDPFVGVWPRGGAKSTSAEMGCVALGARRRRRYGLYVCDTQDQADDHVANIGGMLESDGVARFYPSLAARMVGKYGNSKGWRRNRLRTAAGFTVDAIGLDTASRGVKLDENRPDFIVLDDIDREHDSPTVVTRKLDLISKSFLPAGSADVAVLAIQNLIHRDGVFARLVDGRATMLARRKVSGPIPAVEGLVTRHEDHNGIGRDIVIAGEPTWHGQNLQTVQGQIDDWGLAAFLSEAQHAVHTVTGALWSPEQVAAIRRTVDDTPDLAVITVGIDPSGGSGPDNDEQGIVAAGRTHDGHGWLLADESCRLSPAGWGDQAVNLYLELDADRFAVEANYGGDMAVDVIKSAVERLIGTVLNESTRTRSFGKEVTLRCPDRTVTIHVVHASRGKRVRAEPVAALYGRPDDPDTWSTSRVHHAGHFPQLEAEMTTWLPTSKWSPNRLDAAVWAFTDLLVDTQAKGRRRSVRSAA
jgi:hypothetical protein